MKLFIVNGLYLNVDQDQYGPFVWTVECQNSDEALGIIYKKMLEEYPSHRVISIFTRDISARAIEFANSGAARIEEEQTQVPNP